MSSGVIGPVVVVGVPAVPDADVTTYAGLAGKMAPVRAQAVDELEIAAVLEADGVTDAVATARYGGGDVFDLAERLWAEPLPAVPLPAVPLPAVPLPAVPPSAASGRPTASGPWRVEPWRHTLRGALFVLPAACYLPVAGWVAGRPAGALVTGSLVASWSVAQAIAYLGYVRSGYGDRADAARLLRGGLLWAGAGLLVLIVVAGSALRVPLVVLLVAVGQAGYLLGATVALVLGAERALLAALAPGVAGNALALVFAQAVDGQSVDGPAPVGGLAALGAACSAVTVLAALGVAARCTTGARARLPGRSELASAAPHALYGLVAGAALVFTPTARALLDVGVPGDSQHAAGVAILLPLTASMGAAEWLLVRYRAAAHAALHQTRTLAEFRVAAGEHLVTTVTTYLALLAGASVLAGWVADFAAGTAPVLPLASMLALGGALFVALTVLSFGGRAVVVAGFAGAVAVEWLLVAVAGRGGAGSDSATLVAAAQLAAAGALFVVLLLYAMTLLSAAARHR